MAQWYEEIFDNYGETYDNESFTQGTAGEVEFILQEINHDKQKRILDIGCGTGRHAIELAKRGFKITGVDLSNSQLERAKQKAASAKVDVDFQLMDARYVDFVAEFDLVMMICEGAFPLMELDEMNYRILQNAERALKFGGKLIFTTLNALYPLYHDVKEFLNKGKGEQEAHSQSEKFDLLTFRSNSVVDFKDDSGRVRRIQCSERYYTPSEITWYLKTLGFKKIDIYGCRLGAFSRNDALTVEDYEMLVIAEK